ncbi:Protein IQ-DOMAIN 31 [Quillaja saponaria]|uniref:Protein IQ-DOMAIN 31 n=1 Tax=Quillaja saponaria TaxID=32244 RepID=A0AAD7PFL1_QUISA|nr:Protein IQ-DOMAIN 31 [Quillaja saponaria]
MSYQKHDNHQTVDTDEGLPKRGASKTSGANAENGSIGSSGSEKSKHNPRKVISHPELSVGKFNSRKIPSSTKEVSDKTEVGKDKRKPIPRKLSASTAPDVSQQASAPAQKMEVLPVPIPEKSDLNTCPKFQVADEQVDKLHNYPVINLQTTENIGRGEGIEGMNQELNYSDCFISNENAKTCHRRASLPAKFDGQENVVRNTPRLPSYMSPTESAKAKLRGQDSSRLAQDIAEKNVTTRRHSLSSSANGKISSLAPRVPSLVSMNGRGVIRADRSLSSSRDGCDKVVQPEWRS